MHDHARLLNNDEAKTLILQNYMRRLERIEDEAKFGTLCNCHFFRL